MGGGGDHKEKTTVMVLKVDLQCPCCYKKTKQILCKIPRVRDQWYDEKANTVTITVVCCSPERIRDKLCCNVGKMIKSIEIKKPEKPKPKVPMEPEPKPTEPNPKPKESKDGDNSKGPEKPMVVQKLKKAETPQVQEKPTVIDKPKDKPKDAEKPKDGPTATMVATPRMSEPMMMMPPVQGYPQVAHGCGCGQCYYIGGPCYQYYGMPAPPQPAPYYGNSYGYGLGPGPSSYGKGCYVNDDYFNDENAQGCTIMQM